MLAIERAQRELPEGFAVLGVGGEAEVREEGEDGVGACGDGGGGSVVEGVLGFAFGGANGLAPQYFAGLAVEAEGEEIVAFRGGEEDFVADDDGGGFAFGEIGLPADVFCGAEFGGEGAAGGAEAGAVGAAELGPVGGGEG